MVGAVRIEMSMKRFGAAGEEGMRAVVVVEWGRNCLWRARRGFASRCLRVLVRLGVSAGMADFVVVMVELAEMGRGFDSVLVIGVS